MIDRSWQYFLYLDEEAITLSRYIDFSQYNLSGFSMEIARIQMSACAEIYNLVYDIYNQKVQRKPSGSINKIIDEMAGFSFPFCKIKELCVDIPRADIDPIQPLKEQGQNPPSEWWNAYNGVKHDRTSNYKKANLKNLIYSMAGLLVILVCYICNKSEYCSNGQTENCFHFDNNELILSSNDSPRFFNFRSAYHQLAYDGRYKWRVPLI